MNVNPIGWASRTLEPLLSIVRSSPNATVPVVVVSEPVTSETSAIVNSDIALVAKGTGATLAHVPDGTAVGGNKRGTGATDWQKVRDTASQVASARNATIAGGSYNTASTAAAFAPTVGGGERNTASASYATVAGGTSNLASGTYSFVGSGASNTASSNYSFVGGGQSNTAQTNTHATVCGGQNNTASGARAFIGGGLNNTASAGNASVLGGHYNTASSIASSVLGGRRGISRNIAGYTVLPACNAPIADTDGVTQSALLLLARQTTDATATVLTSDSSAAAATNQVTLPNNSAYSFSGEVIAGVTGGGNAARWTINGAIKRGANAASTTMVGTATVTMTHNDAGAAAWVVAVTADTTNGGIAVTVTGAAATTIRWVCKINTTEMTY